MNVICIEEQAFYALLDKVYDHLENRININSSKWITDVEAMKLLNIKAKSTLQNLRDEGKIRFTHPQKRIILYDPKSINDYLDKHARNTF